LGGEGSGAPEAHAAEPSQHAARCRVMGERDGIEGTIPRSVGGLSSVVVEGRLDAVRRVVVCRDTIGPRHHHEAPQ